MLYGVERTLREPGWRRRHLVLTGAVYCTITGGQPEVAFLSLLTVSVYGVMRLLMQKHRIWRALWTILPGALEGLLLAAPMWVNFLRYAFTAYSAHQAGSTLGQLSLD